MTWKKISILAIFIFVGVFVANASPAAAATKYFNFGGSNVTQNGTEANPYTTLSQFTSNVSAGDTVYVTGTLTSSWTIGLVGTSSAPTTIARWSGQPTLSVSVSGGSGITISSAQYLNLSGVSTTSSAAYGLYLLNSSNITLSTISATSTAGSGLFISNADNVTISSLTVSNPTGTGIVITEGSTNGTISNSTVTNTGSNAYGVFIGKEFSSTIGSNTGWTFDDVDITTTGNTGFDCSSSSNDLTLKNSTITGATGTSGHGINITQCDNVTLTNNTTYSNAKNGVNVQTASNVTISGSTSYSNTQSGFALATITTGTLSSNTAYSNTQSGISLSGSGSSNITITGNTTYSNTQSGIVASALGTGLTVNANKSYGHTSSGQSSGFGFSIASTAPTVTNNVSYGNRIGVIVAATSGSVANPTIRNNTVYNSSSAAITFVESGQNTITGVTMQNNTFTTATDGQVISYAGGDGPTWTSSNYNNFQLVGSAANITTGVTTLEAWRTTSSQDANSLSVDPLFTSTTSGSENFALQNTSTLIDAGNPSATTPTTDYAGATRPYGASGSRMDIGAYENALHVRSTNVSMAAAATVASDNTHTITLTITDSTNPATTTYAIATNSDGSEWLTTSGGTSSSPAYSTSKTWTHTSLTGNTSYSYYFRIADSDQTTLLALSSAVSGTTALAAPSAVTLTAGTTTLGVSWTAPAGTVTSYTVSYGDDSAAADSTATGITGTSTTLTGLTVNTTYYVKVRAHNSIGAGAYSSATSKATVASLPETITQPTTDDGKLTQNTATVSWSSVASVTGYVLSYGTDTAASNLGTVTVNSSGQVTSQATLTYTFEGLQPDTTYYWKIATVTSAGTGAYSSAMSFETTPGQLGIIVVPDHVRATNLAIYDISGEAVVSAMKTFGDYVVKVEALTADLDSDGDLEIIVSALEPSSVAAQVRIFDSSGTFLVNLFPYGNRVKGGANIAVGDVNGDRIKDLVILPNGHHVANLRVYTFADGVTTPTLLAWTPVYGANTRVTADVEVADVNRDGKDDMVVWNQARRPNVQVLTYDATSGIQQVGYVFPYPNGVPAEIDLELADVDGNGTKEIVTIPSRGKTTANLQVYQYDSASTGTLAGVRKNFARLTWTTAYPQSVQGGFELTSGDIDGNGKDEISVLPQKGVTGKVHTYQYYNNQLNLIVASFPLESKYRGGLHGIMADYDNDGLDEFVTTTADGNSTNIRLYHYTKADGWVLGDWWFAFGTERIGARASF